MAFLILSAACIAMVAANGYAPAADNAASYPSHGHAYISAYHDDSRSDEYRHRDRHHRKSRFRKLKDLDGDTIDADIKYYKHDGDDYAVISCKPDGNNYMWILADSDETHPASGPADTVALAGGVNVEYVAKYHNKKWHGKDYNGSDKRKFRKVGCFKGTTTSNHVA